MKYIAPRNLTLASVCGLSIELIKGKPTLCPPGMHEELLALGCVPETPLPEPADDAKPTKPMTPNDRYVALTKAFEAISLRNERTDNRQQEFFFQENLPGEEEGGSAEGPRKPKADDVDEQLY